MENLVAAAEAHEADRLALAIVMPEAPEVDEGPLPDVWDWLGGYNEKLAPVVEIYLHSEDAEERLRGSLVRFWKRRHESQLRSGLWR